MDMIPSRHCFLPICSTPRCLWPKDISPQPSHSLLCCLCPTFFFLFFFLKSFFLVVYPPKAFFSLTECSSHLTMSSFFGFQLLQRVRASLAPGVPPHCLFPRLSVPLSVGASLCYDTFLAKSQAPGEEALAGPGPAFNPGPGV